MQTVVQELATVPLGERIAAARARANMTQQELADALGLSKRAVTGYEIGETEPKLATLKRIAAKTGFPLMVLLGEVPLEEDRYKTGEVKSSPLDSAPERGDNPSRFRESSDGGPVRIDHVSVEVSAGDGANVDIEEVTGATYYEPWYVRERFGVEPARVKAIRVHGSSMEPTIMAGQEVEVVMLRPGEMPMHGGVYVLRGPHGLLLKRLYFDDDEDGRFVRIHSDNPEAGTDRVPLEVFNEDYTPIAHLRSGTKYY